MFIVVATATTIGMLYFFSGNQYLIQREFELIEEKTNSTSPLLTAGISSTLEDAYYLAKDPLIRTINQAIDDNIDETFSFVEDNLESFLESKKDVLRVTLFVGEKNIRTYMSVARKGKETFTTTDEVFHLEAITQRKNYYLTDLRLFKEKEEPYIGIVVPIKSKTTVVGFLKLDLSMERNFIRLRNQLGDLYSLYIFGSEGDYLYHPNSSKSFGFEKGLRYLIQDDYPQTEGFLYGRSLKFKGLVDDNIFFSRKIPLLVGDLDRYVGIAISISKEKVLAQNNTLKRQSFFWTLGIVLLTTLFAWYFSRYLTKNIVKITELAQQFARGKTDISINVDSNDEIGVLALSFQGMIRQVNERTRVLKKSERETRIAKDQLESISRGKSLLLKDLRKQKDEIEKIGRDKDELLAIVSHDLKNPMAVIETAMDLLQAEGQNLTESDLELIKRSKNSAKFALNLITDLLDISRLEGGIKLDYERFNVAELVVDSLESFKLKAEEKDISIKYSFDDDYSLRGDYGRIIQVFNNIIGNAIKFTPVGGEININGKAIQTDEGAEESLLVSISDNGPGIPSDKIDSIFNKYEQARIKDREIGTGLGLAICKNIIELHHGKIWVESEDGEGAVFYFKLPKVSRGKVSDHTRVPNILLVDDSEDFINDLQKGLPQDDYLVTHSNQGLDAEKLASQNKIDLVLLDLDMSYVDGIEVLKRLKSLDSLKNVPFLILAESIKTESLNDLNKLANDFVKKTDGVAAIQDKVDEYLLATSNTQKLNRELSTILVVDDDENIRDILTDTLKEYPLNVLTAKGGLEALFLVKKYPVDIVLTDLRMPEIDGLRLSQMVKEHNPDVKLVLMSGTIFDLPKEVKNKFNIRRLVAKPFNVMDLCKDLFALSKKMPHEKTGAFENPFYKKEVKSSYKVLFVDDAQDMHMLFKVMMKKFPFEITYCVDGKTAVEEYIKDDYDLILMDVNMPVMDGKTAIRKIREIEKNSGKTNVEAWAITANDGSEEVRQLLEAGFSDYMGKPLKKEKIVEYLLPQETLKKIS